MVADRRRIAVRKAVIWRDVSPAQLKFLERRLTVEKRAPTRRCLLAKNFPSNGEINSLFPGINSLFRFLGNLLARD